MIKMECEFIFELNIAIIKVEYGVNISEENSIGKIKFGFNLKINLICNSSKD